MRNGNLIPVTIHHVAFHFLGEDIDVGRGELSSADASFEEEIQFGKSTSGRLGDAEVRVDKAEEAWPGLEENKNCIREKDGFGG